MVHKPAPPRDLVPAYVSSSLTNELKPQLKAYAERNGDDAIALIESAVMAGYGFSCKSEDKTGHQASLRYTDNVQIATNKGKVLVERAGTPTRAILRLLWAHFELFEQKWPDGVRSIEDDW